MHDRGQRGACRFVDLVQRQSESVAGRGDRVGGEHDTTVGRPQAVPDRGRGTGSGNGDDAAAAQGVGELDDAYARIGCIAQPLAGDFSPRDETMQLLPHRRHLVLDDVAIDRGNADDGRDQDDGGDDGDLDQGETLLAARTGVKKTEHA